MTKIFQINIYENKFKKSPGNFYVILSLFGSDEQEYASHLKHFYQLPVIGYVSSDLRVSHKIVNFQFVNCLNIA